MMYYLHQHSVPNGTLDVAADTFFYQHSAPNGAFRTTYLTKKGCSGQKLNAFALPKCTIFFSDNHYLIIFAAK